MTGKRAFGVVAALSMLFAGAPLRAKPGPHAQEYQPAPAMWKLADADTTIYLFGTTHALPKGFKWRTKLLDGIVKRADELVVETVETPESEKAMRETMDALADPGAKRTPVLDRVSAARRTALETAIAGSAFPMLFYDRMPTWMVTFVLAVDDMEQEGQVYAHGVETVLEKSFARSKRPVLAVEDGNAVLRSISAMPEPAQIRMLEDALEDVNASAEEAAQGDHAWARGDMAGLAADFTEAEMGAELYDVLIRRRNTAWTGWLKARLDRPGTVLFAVGAGHFTGADGVQAMLARQGFTVERIQ
jgi:uncharacterized protein